MIDNEWDEDDKEDYEDDEDYEDYEDYEENYELELILDCWERILKAKLETIAL